MLSGVLLFVVLSIGVTSQNLQADLNFAYTKLTDLGESVSLSECSRTSVEELVEQCSIGGIESLSPQLRTELAVKLSICEFQESSLDYPELCHNLERPGDFYFCIQQLRQSSQFWTTYSGNYQKISSICHEAAMPFFKEHLVDLFLNVTQVYTGFYEQMKAFVPEVQMYIHELQEQLEQLRFQAEETLKHQKKQNDDLHRSNSEFRDLVRREQESAVRENEHALSLLKSFGDVSRSLIIEIFYSFEGLVKEKLSFFASSMEESAFIHQDLMDKQNDVSEAMSNIANAQEVVTDGFSEVLLALNSEIELSLNAHHRIRLLASDFELLAADIEAGFGQTQKLLRDTEDGIKLLTDSVIKENGLISDSVHTIREGFLGLLGNINTELKQVDAEAARIVSSLSHLQIPALYLSGAVRYLFGSRMIRFLLAMLLIFGFPVSSPLVKPVRPVWAFFQGLAAAYLIRLIILSLAA